METIDNNVSTSIGLSDCHLSSLTQAHGAVVQRRVEDLRPHPSFAKYNLGRSVPEISILSDRGESAYLQPITITQDGLILDGYSIWHLASMQKRETLLCLVWQMNHQEALLHLIEKSRGSNGLNDFVRILLALELEPWFKSRAKSNQRIGGQQKGSSNLTEDDRLDVRSEIARASNACTGNVTKVKTLKTEAIPELMEALREGEVSIHRAFGWIKSSANSQKRILTDDRRQRRTKRKIAELLRRHGTQQEQTCEGLRALHAGLKMLPSRDYSSEVVELIDQLVSKLEPLLDPKAIRHAA